MGSLLIQYNEQVEIYNLKIWIEMLNVLLLVS